MKILFLNPHWHESPIVTALRNLGVAAIVCSDARECELVLKLHAGGLTLFVGHDEDGIRLNEIIKTTRRLANLPVILTTSKWTDKQCADHQASPMGANAYVRTPIDEKDFIGIIDLVLGTKLAHGEGVKVSDELGSMSVGAPLSIPIATEEKTTLSEIGIVAPAPVALEDATKLTSSENDGISLAAAPSGSAGAIQIEDAASVYGVPTPAPKGEPADDGGIKLEFALDEPSMHLAPNAIEANAKEFKIEEADAGPAIASPILATPIVADQEGTNLAIIPPSDGPVLEEIGGIGGLGSLSDGPEIGEATRVAEPIGDDAPTRVAMSMIPSSSGAAQTGSISNASEELDAEALSAMPYLGKSTVFASHTNPLGYRDPMDDAVVPGGAANAPDAETLKKYLYLREQDVTALSAQLRQARDRVTELENQLRQEKAITSEFAHLAQEQDRRIQDFEKEKAVAVESASKELEDLKFDMKRRNEKIRVMELQVKEATDATERLKERVRNDIRKIRSREKELENRLEIMKKDSEALLGAREHKIIDLKRKLDLIEFNTDLLQDQLEKERKISQGLREKLAKAAQIVRVAGGLLTPEEEALLATGVNPNSLSKDEDDRTTAA